MRWYKKLMISAILIIILSNIPPLVSILNLAIDEKHFRFSNYNGSLTFTVTWKRTLESLENRHRSCLDARPNLKDKNMYRTFTKNPLAFWRWSLYFFDKRYKLPYKNWEEIKKTREKEKIKEVTGCYIEF